MTKKKTTEALKAKGLKIDSGFQFIFGDCFFDCMARLTCQNSIEIRRAAVTEFLQHLHRAEEMATLSLLEVYRSNMHGPALQFDDYINRMAKSYLSGSGKTKGLWADHIICNWTAQALGVRIHVYKEDRELWTTFGPRHGEKVM